jgi:hypothetical protein
MSLSDCPEGKRLLESAVQSTAKEKKLLKAQVVNLAVSKDRSEDARLLANTYLNVPYVRVTERCVAVQVYSQ